MLVNTRFNEIQKSVFLIKLAHPWCAGCCVLAAAVCRPALSVLRSGRRSPNAERLSQEFSRLCNFSDVIFWLTCCRPKWHSLSSSSLAYLYESLTALLWCRCFPALVSAVPWSCRLAWEVLASLLHPTRPADLTCLSQTARHLPQELLVDLCGEDYLPALNYVWAGVLAGTSPSLWRGRWQRHWRR